MAYEPCPEWCQSAHENDTGVKLCVGSGNLGFVTPSGGTAWPRAAMISYETSDLKPRAYVSVDGSLAESADDSPRVQVEPREAGQLAALIELLSEATPEQHHILAAGVRAAQTAITGHPECEAQA